MVATFFLQRTTAFILFLIVPSLHISCFRKTKEKQYAKYDLNKRIAARLIWQLVIHSCVICAYIISRRDGENNGLAGVSLPPSLLAHPSRSSRTQNSLSLPFQTPATQASLMLATVLFFVTIVIDEVRPKVMCIHTKMIIVCRRLRAVKKKRQRLLVVHVCRVCCGSKNSKNLLFRSIMMLLEKSVLTWQFPVSKVMNFGPCWEDPQLVIRHELTVDVIGLVQKMVGGIRKHRLL